MEAPKVKRKGDGFAELTYNDDSTAPVEEKEAQPQSMQEEKKPVVEKSQDLFSQQLPVPRPEVEEKPEAVQEPTVADVAQGAPPWVARSEEGRKPTVMQVVSKPFVRDVKDTRNLIDEQIDAASRDALPVENPPEGRTLSHDEAVEKAREIWHKKQEEDKQRGLLGKMSRFLGFK